jgi:hypothetical protein
MTKLFVFALLGLLPATAAFASQAIIQDFRHNAKVLPAKAMSYNYRRFGDVDLNQVYNEIDRLEIRVVGKVARKQMVGPFAMEREGAEWEVGRGISINGSRWPKMRADSKPMFALHESFGMLRIHDDNFGCSSTIWALTNEEFRATLAAEEIAKFERNAEIACRSSGGSTVVGGGGDEFNVQVRMNAIKMSVRQMQQARSPQERDGAMETANRGLYQPFERGRKGSIDFKNMFKQQKLDPPAVPGTIRVMKDGVQIPEDARNGWTYNASTGVITFHGAAAIPVKNGGMTMGPGVYYTKMQPGEY